jgi:hypothetical protein
VPGADSVFGTFSAPSAAMQGEKLRIAIHGAKKLEYSEASAV